MKKGSKRATILAFLAFLNWSGGISLAVDPTENPILISELRRDKHKILMSDKGYVYIQVVVCRQIVMRSSVC